MDAIFNPLSASSFATRFKLSVSFIFVSSLISLWSANLFSCSVCTVISEFSLCFFSSFILMLICSIVSCNFSFSCSTVFKFSSLTTISRVRSLTSACDWTSSLDIWFISSLRFDSESSFNWKRSRTLSLHSWTTASFSRTNFAISSRSAFKVLSQENFSCFSFSHCSSMLWNFRYNSVFSLSYTSSFCFRSLTIWSSLSFASSNLCSKSSKTLR